MASTPEERLLTDNEIVAVSSTVDSKGFLAAMCAAQDAKSYAAGQEAERARCEVLVEATYKHRGLHFSVLEMTACPLCEALRQLGTP